MAKVHPETTCFHCGEDCQTEVIRHDDHDFCCHGCKTVYTLLEETGLGNYYDLEKAPGSTVKKDSGNHDFLDLEEVRKQFIQFSEGSQNRVTFYLPGIHCSACIWLLEKLERLNPGVIRSEVNFLRKELTVIFDTDRISLKELVILLERLGYSPDLQRDQAKSGRKGESKKLLIKLGVAGFAFGNIMLFSFPEYLSLDDESLLAFKPVFGYLNLLLSLPILLFSDVDYLKSAWKSLRVKYLTIDVPIALGILTLFGRSAFEVISGSGPGYFDSFAGLVFFLLIGKWYQSRTYEALAFDRDFKSYFPMAVARLTNGREEVCMLEKIEPGDRLRIRNNQVIPADSVLIRGNASVDYSFVNGESDMVQKTEGDYLFAGGRQTSGAIEVEVIKEVSQSYLTSLWNQRTFSKEADARQFSSLIDGVSRYFSIAILVLAFSTLAFWLAVDASLAVDAFTAVLIIACPCALALSMPFATGNVSRILGKLGFFIKNAATLERIADVDTIVFDKTGTLTDAQHADVRFAGASLTEEEARFAKSLASMSTHPLSVSIAESLQEETLPVHAFKEEVGKGISGLVNGVEVKLGSWFPEGHKPSGSSVALWVEDHYRGAFSVKKATRGGVQEAIKQLQQQAQTHLLSGDNDSDKKRMEQLFGGEAELRFKQTPMDKLNYIKELQGQGKTVMMLGDGLNDAGALKQADVGIAVADDVFSFSPACDAILQAGQLKKLARFRNYIKQSMNVVKVSIVISLLYNAVGLFFAMQSELTPVFAAILMPLSSVTVVGFVTLLTEMLKPRD